MDTVLSYVICYDVTDDRRRTRLARALDGFGRRVQYSVYEAVLDRPLFDNLVAKISGIINAEVDRVRIYPLCATCASKRVALGADQEWVGDEVVFIV
jgi:CRISPR-associated protein Cas2